MSEYKDFEHCIICRSYQNLKDYRGKYEVTMLLNTLYMTVMKSIENRGFLDVKTRPLADWLKKNEIVNKQGNDYNCDDIIRYLRNGLAHFNLQVNGNEGQIENVRITAKNLEKNQYANNHVKILDVYRGNLIKTKVLYVRLTLV